MKTIDRAIINGDEHNSCIFSFCIFKHRAIEYVHYERKCIYVLIIRVSLKHAVLGRKPNSFQFKSKFVMYSRIQIWKFLRFIDVYLIDNFIS